MELRSKSRMQYLLLRSPLRSFSTPHVRPLFTIQTMITNRPPHGCNRNIRNNLVQINLEISIPPTTKDFIYSKTISMGLLNARSLSNTIFIVNDLIWNNIIDCLFFNWDLAWHWCINGTHWGLPPNYNFFFSFREARKMLGLHALLVTYFNHMQCYYINLFPFSPTPLFSAVRLSFALLFIDQCYINIIKINEIQYMSSFSIKYDLI